MRCLLTIVSAACFYNLTLWCSVGWGGSTNIIVNLLKMVHGCLQTLPNSAKLLTFV